MPPPPPLGGGDRAGALGTPLRLRKLSFSHLDGRSFNLSVYLSNSEIEGVLGGPKPEVGNVGIPRFNSSCGLFKEIKLWLLVRKCISSW